jgi:hypothetical protein
MPGLDNGFEYSNELRFFEKLQLVRNGELKMCDGTDLIT